MRATLSAPCGRDMDKISAAGLTPVEPEVMNKLSKQRAI